jgi:pyruvate dehydrogenase E1 component alpha subunit
VHVSIGEEATPAGVCAALTEKDYITSTHRGHGHHIAKGADMNRLMAELLGKATGYCAGRGGSMHVAACDIGSLGAFPIVASGLPAAVGAALSARLQRKDQVVAAFFGEGGLGQGTFYEAVNMAALWKLAVIFVCENNQYAVSTSVDASIAIQDLRSLAAVYGFPGEEVDGQDVLAVADCAARAVKRARKGEGPTLIHAKTHRFEGHYFGEPQVYRTREEIQHTRAQMDPIELYQSRLVRAGVLSETEIRSIAEGARQAVETALQYAQASPDPNPEDYAEYVYA